MAGARDRVGQRLEDDSRDEPTVRIVHGDRTVATQSTSAPYGVARVSQNLGRLPDPSGEPPAGVISASASAPTATETPTLGPTPTETPTPRPEPLLRVGGVEVVEMEVAIEPTSNDDQYYATVGVGYDVVEATGEEYELTYVVELGDGTTASKTDVLDDLRGGSFGGRGAEFLLGRYGVGDRPIPPSELAAVVHRVTVDGELVGEIDGCTDECAIGPET